MAIFDRKDDYQYVRWAAEVKKRDHYSCQLCEVQGAELNSHHVKAWNAYPEDRYNVDNGVTLCRPCHDNFHDVHGRGDNDEDQFEEFEKIFSVLKKAHLNKLKVERQREEIMLKMKQDGYAGN